jgi:N-acetylmuramoyl-L-alanine amidase
MDNKTEAELMKSTDFRKECSQEIAKGICDYFGKTYKSKPVETTKVNYYVQAGAFSKKANAEELITKLKKDGYNAILKTSY